MRRLRDIHVWMVGYDMVSLSLYHILVLVLARFILFHVVLILTHPAAGRAMSKPRSSRRTSARIATFHVDDEIEISSFRQRRESLRDRVSGCM